MKNPGWYAYFLKLFGDTPTGRLRAQTESDRKEIDLAEAYNESTT